MDFETTDILYRSRQTLLEIQRKKGYNTKPYDKFGPFEVEKMSAGDKENALGMVLKREIPEGVDVPATCYIEYALPKVKNRLAGYVPKLIDAIKEEYAAKNENFNPMRTEIIVLTMESIGDTFHNSAQTIYNTLKMRISFFDARTLVSNPMDHMLVPKHEVVPDSEHAELLKKYNMKSKINLPMIKFHEDIIGRIIGLVPGSIVKITRPSPQAGEYTIYRVCVP
uniref:RNA polymerase subunit H/Rpb5 C-terminal domain-containing protein n=1 Tax=viral metagenome TaxID=1070528 RepID=A0A6C0JZZ7_9ZZZZ